MKIKKAAIFFLTVTIMLSLTGCGCKSTTTVNTEETESPKQKEVEPIIESSYSIEEVLSDFADNKAWVSFNKNNDTNPNNLCYALIDTNGYIVWSVDKNELQELGNWVGLSTNEDTYCIHSNNLKGYSYHPGMIIIDSDGNIKFDSRNADEGVSYYYLGYGDGVYLSIKHLENFSVNEFYFIEISKDGSIISEQKWPDSWDAGRIIDDLHHVNQNFVYMGKDIFMGTITTKSSLRPQVVILYNKHNKSFYLTSGDLSSRVLENDGDLKIVEIISENETLLQKIDNFIHTQDTDYYYLIDTQQLRSSTSGRNMDKKEINMKKGKYGEKLFNCIYSGVDFAPGIYDYNGTLIHKYPEEWTINDCDSFSGGYASLQLKGADGCNYVVVVNSNGETQYEPIKVDSVTYPSFHGYVMAEINKEEVIINPKGNRTEKSEIDKQYSTYTLGNLVVVNGFEKIYNSTKKIYDSFEGINGNTIKKIYKLSNYTEWKEQNKIN